jgi:hypothetical protein
MHILQRVIMLRNYLGQIWTKIVTYTGKNGSRFSALHASGVVQYICTVIYSGILKDNVWITDQRGSNRNFTEENYHERRSCPGARWI